MDTVTTSPDSLEDREIIPIPSATPRLNRRQKAFIDAYLSNGFKPSAAAIKVGYSSRTASVTGSKLLAKTKIQVEIDARLEKARSMARAALPDLVEDAVEDALHAPHVRDKVASKRWLSDIGGVTDRGSDKPPVVERDYRMIVERHFVHVNGELPANVTGEIVEAISSTVVDAEGETKNGGD